MKNKALTYILLIVVGLIWYKVFFRVKDNLFGEDGEIPAPNELLRDIRIASRDTVKLHLDYRDPFYLEKPKPISMAAPEPVVRNTPPPKRNQTPTFNWPKTEYYGLIRNRKSKEPLGLLRVDGLIMNLREGEEIFNGIVVKDINSEALTLQFKSHKKTISRM